MSRTLVIAGAVAAVGFGALVLWYSRRGELQAVRNEAAGPRLPAMPSMPLMPSMFGGSNSAAVPNAPGSGFVPVEKQPARLPGPQAPAGLFGGMWG